MLLECNPGLRRADRRRTGLQLTAQLPPQIVEHPRRVVTVPDQPITSVPMSNRGFIDRAAQRAGGRHCQSGP
jgi:hypothetical protein